MHFTITQDVVQGRTVYYVEEHIGGSLEGATMWATKQQAQAYVRLMNRGFLPVDAERIVRQAV